MSVDAEPSRWPHIHATVPLANEAEAHRILHDRANLGKVVLVP